MIKEQASFGIPDSGPHDDESEDVSKPSLSKSGGPTVYAVFAEITYEGASLIGIYDDPEAAKAAVDVARSEVHADEYYAVPVKMNTPHRPYELGKEIYHLSR